MVVTLQGSPGHNLPHSPFIGVAISLVQRQRLDEVQCAEMIEEGLPVMRRFFTIALNQ